MALKRRLGVVAALFLVLRALVSAQSGGATARLSGIVVDSAGAVLPGVTVVVRNAATGLTLPSVVTNAAGLFSVPALDAASYTVTCTLSGFKTVVIGAVTILTATPTDLKVTLEVGDIAEVVQVVARSEVVHRQSTTISSTLSSDQIRNLPLNTKDALNFVTFLPGFDTGGVHNIRTATSAVGLPQSAFVISIDGVQTQHPITKSTDGFWSYISPQIDAMEEVTVATATPGAEASAHGAVQIRFTTRSGSDHYTGAFFETWRDPILNANTFFNKVNGLPVNQITMNQYGGNAGGPIVLPRLNLRRKAFFFVDLERLKLPSENTRRPLFMSPAARNGLFTYTTNNIARQVNVLDVARANGQIASIDPTIAGLLGEIAAAATRTGSTTPTANGNTIGYSWNSPDTQSRLFSTNRIDAAAGAAHRVGAVYTFNKFERNPNSLAGLDPRFPGLPNHGANLSPRNSVTGTTRSMFTPTLVGEATFGVFWTSNTPGAGITSAQFDNQGGHSLVLAGGGSAFAGLTPATSGLAATDANGAGNHTRTDPGSVWSAAERMNWQHGRHGVQFGGELTMVKGRATSRQIVPALSFDVDTANDPAAAMFSQVNFPGASNTDLADARFLYALLTGRVKEITTELGLDPRSGQYAADTPADRRAHMSEIGLFAQDAFRVTPHLTLNVGLRYELQLPFRGDDSVWSYNTISGACGVSGTGNGPGGRPCNIFKPGTLTGITPVYHRYTAGTTGYDIDWNNLAPSAGLAWLPGIESGVLHKILGDPEQATIRAAYARALVREGLETFAGPYEANPGASFRQVRNADNGTLVRPGETWPVLLGETTRLGALPYEPQYPLPIDRTVGVNLFDPHWKVGSADSFSAGIQRAISHNMAVELRYVGTYGRDLTYAGNLLEVENWNEINIVENGFLNEFTAAQSNLYANLAAGRGQTIAYAGPGTGTSPLPTYLAYFTGSGDAGNPAAYTGTTWTNGTIIGRFAALNPNPGASALDLHNNATFRSRALAAGLAPNFFVLNPDVGNVNVIVSKVSTRYHALQIDLRRQLSRGLAMTAGYAYAKSWVSRLDSVRSTRYLIPQAIGVPHSLKLTTNYEIPFGPGRRFGADGPSWLTHIAGNWSVNLTGKVTSGRMVNFGNVRIVGMTLGELQDAFKYRIVRNVPNGDGTVTTRVYNLPQDIIDNTVKEFSVNVTGYTAGAPTGRYFAPANGPDCIQVVRGDCAPKDLFVVAPSFTRFDFSAQKRIPTGGKTSVLFEADVLNLFNAINFNPVGLPNAPTNPDNYRVTTSYQDVNNTFDPGSRVGQLAIRFKW